MNTSRPALFRAGVAVPVTALGVFLAMLINTGCRPVYNSEPFEDLCSTLDENGHDFDVTSSAVVLLRQESDAAGTVCWLEVTMSARPTSLQTWVVTITDTSSTARAESDFNEFRALKCEIDGRCESFDAPFSALVVHDCSAELDTFAAGCQPRIVHWVVGQRERYVITVMGFFSPVDVPTAVFVISALMDALPASTAPP